MLSNRYISDRQLPDKAIDLIDEAAALIRTEIDSQPYELDKANRQIMQLEIEREALKRESDKASRERLRELEKKLAELKESQAALLAQWENEKTGIERLRSLKEQIETVRREIDEAKRIPDYNRAAELEYGRLPQLEKELEERNEAMESGDGQRNGQGRSRPGRCGPGHSPVDRHPGFQADGRGSAKSC